VTGRETGDSWRVYDAPETDEVERENRDPSGRPIDPPAPAGAARKRRPAVGLLVGVGMVGAGAAAFLLLGDREPAPDPLPAEESYRPIIDQATLDAVAAEVERATGATEVLDVWIHGTDELRLTVPPVAEGELADEFVWDGEVLEKVSAARPRDLAPFSLDVIDPDVLVGIDEEARSRSDGSISDSRAHITKPVTEYDDWIYLTVDEVDHGGVTLWADLEGEIDSELTNEDWRDD